jgi:hypothetical protein
MIGREGTYLVFDRAAFRQEVVQYLWGGGFQPTQGELSGRGDIVRDPQAGELELGSTHWALARTAFAARPEILEAMRPEARQLMDEAPDLTAGRPPPRPSFVPDGVWQRFLTAGPGIHHYPGASELGTTIILIRRDGGVGGYAEAIADEDRLYAQLRILPASTLRRLIGAETAEQAAVRYLAHANGGYNEGMLARVTAGADPIDARREYLQDVNRAYLEAYVSAVGFMGSMGPLLAVP